MKSIRGGHRKALSDVTFNENSKHRFEKRPKLSSNFEIEHDIEFEEPDVEDISDDSEKFKDVEDLEQHELDKVALEIDNHDDSNEENEEPEIDESEHQHQHQRQQQHDRDDEDHHQQAHEEENHPMEPIWNQTIYEELEMIISKYATTTLDENDEDTFDVTMVAEYSPEIFNYMRELEFKYLPDPNYMNNQDELKWKMRSVLIDWVVQVHSRFNLLPETLFLSVNYIDRFLSKRKVSLSRFQLVGAVALFIAAKYEEINCPTVQEVAYMADNAYLIQEFLKAERFMIDVLEFDMGWPGPMSFLRRTSKADDYDYETRTLAKYFLEITIMDSKFVSSQPSWLAAGAHYLSRKLLNKGKWTDLHIFYSGYTEMQLKPLARVLLSNCKNPIDNHKSIFEKYQERRYKRSSAFVQEYLEQYL